MNEVTAILSAIDRGDAQAAARLLPLVYDELRKLAAARLALDEALEKFAVRARTCTPWGCCSTSC